jgi:hypothetical protein
MGLSDGDPRHYQIFIISLLAGVLITTSIYIFIPYFVAKGNLKKMSLQQRAFWPQPGVLSTTENGLILVRTAQEKESVYEIKWIHIDYFDGDNNSIIIRMVDKKYFLVPKRFFSSEKFRTGHIP